MHSKPKTENESVPFELGEEKPAVKVDEAALAALLDDLLHLFLEMHPTKPSNPDIWVRLGRLDKLRRDLQRTAGQEPTELVDPHGRVAYDHGQIGGGSWPS